jgi:alkylation response protein AidB-like acyl-CoA dehydrogenase
MEHQDIATHARARRNRLLAGLAALRPAMGQRAGKLDRSGGFPAEDIAALAALGMLAAPVPVALGGLGMGTEPEGVTALFHALATIGQGSLSVGRLVEAHVNALRLITLYGSQAQARAAAEDALAGHLYGLWVTDAPGDPACVGADAMLRGRKNPCSGAGFVRRALITAALPDGTTRMLALPVETGVEIDDASWDPHGMRATCSAAVRFVDVGIEPAMIIGGRDDYLRQPEFSAGAWRTAAVIVGGLSALVEDASAWLAARRRDGDPHQRARVGEALIAQETARLWIWRAALIAERNEDAAEDVAGYVNLARLAAEAACLDAIRLVQRSLGMAAMQRGTVPERLYRELALYLRQPAPDITLTEAAAHFMAHVMPPLPDVA